MDSSLAALRREAALKVLVPLFFLSGATSLVYETVWGRALHLVFGTGQVAIATVLAAFMGGLSLGGLLMARFADLVRRPVLVYGLLEGAIGLYALIFPWLLHLSEPIYLGFWRAAEPSPDLVPSPIRACLSISLPELSVSLVSASCLPSAEGSPSRSESASLDDGSVADGPSSSWLSERASSEVVC